MADPSSPTSPTGAPTDFMLGQMAQSITALREEMAHMREDLRALSTNYVTRPEYDKLQSNVDAIMSADAAAAETEGARKVVDRLILAGLTTLSGSIGAAVAAILLKPGLLT